MNGVIDDGAPPIEDISTSSLSTSQTHPTENAILAIEIENAIEMLTGKEAKKRTGGGGGRRTKKEKNVVDL
eukprot:6214706-Pleurochrysis_carterae.AAC.1